MECDSLTRVRLSRFPLLLSFCLHIGIPGFASAVAGQVFLGSLFKGRLWLAVGFFLHALWPVGPTSSTLAVSTSCQSGTIILSRQILVVFGAWRCPLHRCQTPTVYVLIYCYAVHRCSFVCCFALASFPSAASPRPPLFATCYSEGPLVFLGGFLSPHPPPF